jgi:hypothetical protein
MSALQTAAADPNTSDDDLKQKIEAVRTARAKARADLDAAVKDLEEVLTPDQQAMLVALGYLE